MNEIKSVIPYLSVSGTLIKENLRKYRAIPILSFIVYAIAGIVPSIYAVMPWVFWEDMSFHVVTILGHSNKIFLAMYLLVPIITGVILFKHLYATEDTTSVHVIPYTRAKLFNSNVLSGVILVIIPIIMVGIILFMITIPIRAETGVAFAMNWFSALCIVRWMWQSAIIILFIYATTIFAGVVTNKISKHVFLTLGINFIVPFLLTVATAYGYRFLYGFTTRYGWDDFILSFSPLLKATADWWGIGFSSIQYIYICISMLILILSMFLYHKRKRETNPDSPFKVSNKSKMRSWGICALIAVVLMFSIIFNIIGFENRIPPNSRINSVTLERFPVFERSQDMFFREFPILTSSENIEAFRELHRNILENSSRDYTSYEFSNQSIKIHYQLGGLFDMRRAYMVDFEFIRNSAELAQIFESDEFKSYFSLSNFDFSRLTQIEVSNGTFSGDWMQSSIITNRSGFEELLSRIELDFAEQTYEEMVSLINDYALLTFRFDSVGISADCDRCGIPAIIYRCEICYVITRNWAGLTMRIPRTHVNTIELLQNHGHSEVIQVPLEMINTITITRIIGEMSEDESLDIVKITDFEQMVIILETLERHIYTSTFYSVSIEMRDYEHLEPAFSWWSECGESRAVFNQNSLPRIISEMFESSLDF